MSINTLQTALTMFFSELKVNPSEDALSYKAQKIGEVLEMTNHEIAKAEMAARLDLQHRAQACEGWEDAAEYTYRPTYSEGRRVLTWKIAK